MTYESEDARRTALVAAIARQVEPVLGLTYESGVDWKIVWSGTDGNIRFEVVEDGIASKYIWTLNFSDTQEWPASIDEAAKSGLLALRGRLVQRGIIPA